MKVCYYFGAGASRNALPIVGEIPQRILDIIERIKDIDGKLNKSPTFQEYQLPITKPQALQLLINDLNWLAEKARNHASVDTYAKKLFIKEEFKELKKLKVVLSIYFILEQASSQYDKRYDTFLASIIKSSISEFPNNVRIISWNYDFQLEQAFAEYSGINEINENQKMLNVFAKHSYQTKRSNQFGVYKINGTTSFIDTNRKSEYNYCNSFQKSINEDFLTEVLQNYAIVLHSNMRLYCTLSFAWEQNVESFPNILEETINDTSDTDILIVIGYSFPYFNREVDRRIIKSMTKLKKVFFQAPDSNSLKERFMSIRDDIPSNSLVTRFDIDQFLLPNEL